MAKLTDWANEPTLADLKADIEGSRPTQQVQIGKINGWLDNLNVTGTAKFQPKKGRSGVQPRLIRKQAEWRYSNLTEPFLSSDNLFNVKPASFEDTKAALQNQMVLNWQFRTKLDRVNLVDEFIRTVTDEGTVILQIGWIRESHMETIQAPVYSFFPIQSEEEGQMLQQAADLKASNPAEFEALDDALKEAVNYSIESQTPVRAELTGYQDVQQEKLTKNQPTVQIRNTANVYPDPSCNGVLADAQFIGLSFETSFSALKRDGRYKNLDGVNWEAQNILSAPDHITKTPQDFNFKDKARKKVWAMEYWGFWDIADDGVLVPIVATWLGETLIRLEKSPFQSLPFVIVPYMPVKKSVYGEPDGELLGDNQKIIGAVTRGMIDSMARSANGQIGMAKNMLDVPNRRKFDNGDDYEFNPNTNPLQGVVEHKFPELSNSAPMMLQLQNLDAESLTGVKAFAQGLTGSAFGEMAKGAQGVMDAAAKREASILRRLGNAMGQIGLKVMAMNAEFLSEEEVIRVTNEQFVTVRRDELQGNFDMIVEVATDESNDARAQELSFMLQTIGNSLDFAMTQMILVEIARLRKMPDLAKKIEEFEQQPDPILVKKAELEVAELEAKIKYLDQQTQESMAKAELNMAQAALAGSKKDLTDLDFVETDTGTKHAREKDKQGAQARANQDLEVTKAIVNRHKDVEGATPDSDITTAVGFNQLT